MLKDAAVKFPAKDKNELTNLFPPGTKMACRVGDKETHFDELAERSTPMTFRSEHQNRKNSIVPDIK
jgi:hypothetical protein